MERILTAEQMRLADKYTVEKLGVSEETLIERAGEAVAEEILKRFKGGRVLVCVGKGNNGKDGQVIASILSKRHGFFVAVINVSNGIFKLFEKKYDIIVDCIFGTGLNRDVDGKFKSAIEKINASGAFVISCDIPSGINGTTGKVMGVAVKANLTVAIQEYKLGHFINSGIDYCGEVVAKDIGISIWGDDYVKRLNENSLLKFFKPRSRNLHKGNLGKCAVIGGSRNYTGSVVLTVCALFAFKMGVGYVNLVVPESLFPAYVGKIPECLLTPMNDSDGTLQPDAAVLDKLLSYDSIAVGMGMGNGVGTYKIIEYLLKNYDGRLVIDADGLNSLAEFGLEILKDRKCEVVLTPHVGEFSRLSGFDSENENILENTIETVVDFARRNNVVVLMKNSVSVVSDGDAAYINTTGTVGMAKAGSGDVLSGIIAGLLSTNKDAPAIEVTAAASCLFGLVGEFVEKKQNEFTMTASDLIKALPDVVNKIIKD